MRTEKALQKRIDFKLEWKGRKCNIHPLPLSIEENIESGMVEAK